jgi:hypothetical protein
MGWYQLSHIMLSRSTWALRYSELTNLCVLIVQYVNLYFSLNRKRLTSLEHHNLELPDSRCTRMAGAPNASVHGPLLCLAVQMPYFHTRETCI